MKKERIEITLTDVEPKDAKPLLDFYKIVGEETPYLIFGSEGLGLNQEQETRYIKQLQTTDNNRLIIARLGNEIIGVASIGASQNPKLSHVGEIGICILRRFWSFGLSRVLMEDLLDWAEDNETLRLIRLEVHSDNIRAIKLYEKYDFKEVGRLSGAMIIDGEYGDTIIMEKMVDSE